jgi:peroxiredoxin
MFAEEAIGSVQNRDMETFHDLPPGLPVPEDDGAADHLRGALPSLPLRTTSGENADLSAIRSLVLYVYPRTGVPGQALPLGWDEIPGARGCTPQNCAFRDLHEELRSRGATVHGISAQPLAEQREFAVRERMPYPLLNDSRLRLAEDPGLPTFDVGPMRLYKRLTLIARRGAIEHVIYPVFPPGSDAATALALLE